MAFSIMPWQFGALGLTEDGGNRIIKYADAILNGVRNANLLYLGGTEVISYTSGLAE